MTTTAPDNRRTASLLALMKHGDDAFNAHDVEAMNAVHHPDMVAHITGNAGPLFGRAAHAQAMQAFFAMFPDVHVHNDPYPVQFGSGNWITVVTRTTGTFTGGLVLPDGHIVPPTGKSFDVEFGQTVRWVGEQVVEIAAFWDSALQARQIGLAPAVPGQGDSA
jgi:ketosteroid isomerase-like protein